MLATVVAVSAITLSAASLLPRHSASPPGSSAPSLPTPLARATHLLPTIKFPVLPRVTVPPVLPLPQATAGRPAIDGHHAAHPVPALLVAFTPGGAERPTVVRTATGATVRVLGPGIQYPGVLSSDHARVYIAHQATVGPCEREWKTASIATGATRDMPGLRGLTAFAESPSSGQVAAVIGPDSCGNAGSSTGNVLQVKNLDTGHVDRQARLPDGNWFVEAWSPDGGELLLDNIETGTTHVIFDSATLELRRVVPPSARGCKAGDATLRGDGDVILAETCSDAKITHVDLIDLNADGKEIRRVRVASGPVGKWDVVRNGLGLDRSRQNVVLSLSPGDPYAADGQLWYVAGTTPHRVGLTGVFGAFW
jgi:hypothetical protein